MVLGDVLMIFMDGEKGIGIVFYCLRVVGLVEYAEAINCNYSMMMMNGGRNLPSTLNSATKTGHIVVDGMSNDIRVLEMDSIVYRDSYWTDSSRTTMV